MTGADIAHLLGGAMLVLALLMLAQRRVATAIGAYALQSAALAGAAAAQGWAQGRLGLWLMALVLLGVQGVAIPAALRIVSGETQDAAGRDRGSPGAMAAGVVVVVLAILAVRDATLPAVMAREDLAAALSVALLGLLMVITRRGAMGQMLGFLAAVSGCSLAAVSMPGLPLLAIVLGWGLLGVPVLGVAMLRHASPARPPLSAGAE